jgi:hypothetical protein
MVFSVLMAVLVLAAGCVSGFQTSRQPLIGGSGDVYENYGKVPVVFVNPSPGLTRRVWLFRGSERVELVPDARNGGWMFNRPPEKFFQMPPADGSNWYADLALNLPRDTSYTVYDQAVRAVGGRFIGQPNIMSFTTGSNPTATIYYKQSPMRGQAQVGGVVQLPFVDPRGPDQLRIHIDVDPQQQIQGALDHFFKRR